MVLYRVDKVVVVTLLEATKSVLEQVGAYRMELADLEVDDSRRLVSLYSDLRRLKDYLHRCVIAFRDQVDLDLSDEDLPLMAACCQRGAEILDWRSEASADEGEQVLFRQKRDTLIDWAIESAAVPVADLMLPDSSGPPSAAIRGMYMRLHQKQSEAQVTQPAVAGAAFSGAFSGAPMAAFSDEEGPVGDAQDAVGDGAFERAEGREWAPPQATWNPPEQPADAGSAAHVRGAGPSSSWRSESAGSPATEPVAESRGASEGKPTPAAASPGAVRAAHGRGAPMAAEVQGAPGAMGLMFDGNRIRDPRLRSMMALDLRAYNRAVAANDLRMAAVHLTSVIEGAVIDHAIPLTLELGLAGPPESWDVQEVLLRVLGDRCTSRDRAAVYHVFGARSLIQPATQLKAPVVITLVSLGQHREFALRALREMGYLS